MTLACPICLRPTSHWMLCDACSKSYAKNAHNDGSVLEAMEWAAERARCFARRGRRKK